jgi:CheY-like chemotaxis protein
VISAEDGRTALALAQSQKPALVFLDLAMPGLGGAATLQALRSLPGGRDLPVVIMTAGSERLPELVGDAEALLRKPFEVEDLVRIVRAHVPGV